MYRLEIGQGAQRQIRRLPTDVQQRILRSIDALAENPRPHGAIKLSGGEGYRVRVGDYRILYWIDDANQRVEVHRVMAREDVYRVR